MPILRRAPLCAVLPLLLAVAACVPSSCASQPATPRPDAWADPLNLLAPYSPAVALRGRSASTVWNPLVNTNCGLVWPKPFIST